MGKLLLLMEHTFLIRVDGDEEFDVVGKSRMDNEMRIIVRDEEIEEGIFFFLILSEGFEMGVLLYSEYVVMHEYSSVAFNRGRSSREYFSCKIVI